MDFSLEECTQKSQRGCLFQARVSELRPTQSGVGLDEVYAKAEALARKNREDLSAFLLIRPVPVVIGNGNRLYLTDHHHLGPCSRIQL